MNKLTNKILIVDDDIDILNSAKMFLKHEFEKVTTTTSPFDIESLLEKEQYSVVLLDMNFKKGVNTGKEGLYWLEKIKSKSPNTVVILITAYGEVDLAVQAIKSGATDFILKPWKNQKLLGTILSSIALYEGKVEIDKLKNKQSALTQENNKTDTFLFGQSAAMLEIQNLLEKIAPTEANIVILGENGTGKSKIAKHIHTLSERSEYPFINIDLGSIPENLLESELFGHRKGAFTDAKENKIGKFELADKGTLFLDEIGNLSNSAQTKFLQVLQNRALNPLGSNQTIPFDTRLICATNANLTTLVQEGKFRSDLLYRINTVEITLPPLRERVEDITPLANYFLNLYASKYNKNITQIDPVLIKLLKAYSWPGNIRELQHSIERGVILSEGNLLDKKSFIFHTHERKDNVNSKPKKLEEMEKEFIAQALRQNDGNVSKTAQILGITRTAMYRRLKKHGLN